MARRSGFRSWTRKIKLDRDVSLDATLRENGRTAKKNPDIRDPFAVH